MIDELATDAGTCTRKHGGDIYRAKYRCGRDRLSILESLDVDRVADIFHFDDRAAIGLVIA